MKNKYTILCYRNYPRKSEYDLIQETNIFNLETAIEKIVALKVQARLDYERKDMRLFRYYLKIEEVEEE